CHESLVFAEAKSECSSCHNDIHQNSVGINCEDCHQTNTWIVSDINSLHERSRFPLLGNHLTADCQDCHISSQELKFQTVGIECVDCHRKDYLATNDPNHAQAGFSTDCVECHILTETEWSFVSTSHEFFPLTGGHNISDCFSCHSQDTYSGLSQDCFSCHEQDYNTTTDLNHIALGFPTDCIQCHTTNPGWSPAQFLSHNDFYELLGAHAAIAQDCNSCHSQGFQGTPNTCFGCHESDYNATNDPSHLSSNFSQDCEECHSQNAWEPSTFDHDNQNFPIYSGEHTGEWDKCSDCHTNPTNFQVFTCTDCHEHNQNEMNSEHSGINGYSYQSTACYSCHPTGSEESSFNHSNTGFPLEGAHVANTCEDCHASGFSNTSSDCISCHTTNFNSTTDPNHLALSFPQTCDECHTTQPGWSPASYTNHDNVYPLVGAHAVIANNCNDCHTDYNNTPNTCFGCHETDYNSTGDPAHLSAGFSQNCEDCHNPNAWEPSTFDHDNQFFPIYLGKHSGEWDNCSDCHNVPSSYQVFTCIDCHEHNQTDMNSEHAGINGYSYESNSCYACHPTGEKEGTFDHASTGFPIDGAHVENSCNDCHATGYTNTSSDCVSCHSSEYTSTTNPNHQTLSFSQTCDECHTTQQGWSPAIMSNHSDFYSLTGAHNTIASDCNSCHEGNYTSNKSECNDCHSADYQATSNPNHQTAGLTTDCESCHTTNPGWTPASYTDHNDVFPIIGAHTAIANNCNDCHNNNYSSTPNTCFGCHSSDYNSVSDPQHNPGFSTDCESCHSQNAWEPSTFDHDLQLFPIYSGEHNGEWNNCSDCHNVAADYNQFTCIDCHEHNNKSEMDSEHNGVNNYSYTPTSCYDCHPDGTEDGAGGDDD
ncbi:MAG: hypothetical protein K9G44_09180, partial [Melioribacteraceae bacterium]|nr:hypothetical protein [Melioribacteraceae bacterium]